MSIFRKKVAAQEVLPVSAEEAEKIAVKLAREANEFLPAALAGERRVEVIRKEDYYVVVINPGFFSASVFYEIDGRSGNVTGKQGGKRRRSRNVDS